MDTRVAVISIIVEQEDAIEELNTLLHEAPIVPYEYSGIEGLRQQGFQE